MKRNKVVTFSVLGGTIVDLFLKSWVVMLLLGALLGNQGLWTPAYWEVFGGLYLLAVVVTHATSAYWNTIRALIHRDARLALSKPKEII